MLVKTSQHVHIYLQPFTSYSEILVGNRNFFLPPLHLTPPYGSSGPWDNRGKCYMDRKRIQCWPNASQHVPIYIQPFPSNSSRKIERSPFSTFFAHFGLPYVRPWDNRVKFYMNRKRIQCWSNASQHVPIYLQPFLRYSEISVASDWFLTVFVSE